VRDTAPLTLLFTCDKILPEPENTYAAVLPEPENVAVLKENEDPDFNPITVFPVPEYDLVFAASIAKITESNEEFFGPL
jgi:hypothetical protein